MANRKPALLATCIAPAALVAAQPTAVDADDLPDELNPAYIFSLTANDLLLQALRGEIDLMALARRQLANRGLGTSGEWVGFAQAERIWATTSYSPQLGRFVTIPE